MVGQGGQQGEVSCETDRARFIGRGRTLAENQPLCRAFHRYPTRPVPCWIPSARCGARSHCAPRNRPHRSRHGHGGNPGRGAGAGGKILQPAHGRPGLDLAWTHSQVTLRHLNASEADAQLYARLASPLIYANPARRASPSVLLNNRRGQSGLWGYGISGDAPIVLLRISDSARIELVQQLLQAHSYWRMKGLPVDLVILNEDVSVYRQPLQDQILRLIASGIEDQMLDKPGGIFVRRLEQVSSEDRVLLQSVARLVLADENGTLTEQLERPGHPEPIIPLLRPARSPSARFA
jgi:cyclic beta-1,2-glucan synthetase